MTSTTSEGVDNEAEETASLTEARRHHQIQGRRPGIQSSQGTLTCLRAL